jgi:hypothetical protein
MSFEGLSGGIMGGATGQGPLGQIEGHMSKFICPALVDYMKIQGPIVFALTLEGMGLLNGSSNIPGIFNLHTCSWNDHVNKVGSIVGETSNGPPLRFMK